MVHALEECWRVLEPRGWLLDIRPITSRPPVEVIFNGRARLAGQVDDTAGEADDRASNGAIEQLIRRGRLVREQEQHFEYAYYWDTLQQMKAYIDDKWSDSAILGEPVMEKARRLVKTSDGPIRIRVRIEVLITRYRKRPAMARS
jgi:hypothetical protein